MPVIRKCSAILAILLILPPALAVAGDVSQEKIIIKPQFSPLESQGGQNDDGVEPGIGLALSGGGARGLALIGVLRVLDREHIKIKFISAVSMGAIIGGLYSCGYTPDEIERIALNVDWGELLSPSPLRNTLLVTQKGEAEKSLLKIRFEGWRPVLPRAITSAQNLTFFLETLTSRGGIRPSISFDYLDPPIRVVCTDLSTGEKVVLSSGNLGEALRASIAIPVAFTPVEINGRLLVDGGLVDPIPVDLARQAVEYPVVAVNVSSGLLPVSSIDNVVGIADQTTNIMSIDKKRESLAQADLAIVPDLYGMTSGDFSRIRELIEAGEEAAEKAIPEIRQLLEEGQKTSSDQVEYLVSSAEIHGLALMPRTFFESSFRESSHMTSDMIKINLKKAYSTGYLSEAWAELIPETSSYCLQYHLVDNPRLTAIEFKGATLFTAGELYGLISSRPGMVMNFRAVDRDRRVLESHYIQAGYSLIRVNTRFEESEGLLVFNVDEGRINRIVVEGNERTKSWVIRRHIPFDVGDIYVQRQAERGIEDIYGTDLFETTKLLAVPDTTGSTLIVKVLERPFNFLRAGARMDLEYGSRAFIDLVDDNLFGTGQEIYLSTKVGEKKRSVSLNFQADRIFETLFTYRFVLDYQEFKRNHYVGHDYKGYFRQFSDGVELSLGRQLPRLGTIAAVGAIRRFSWDEPTEVGRQKFAKLSVGFRSVVDTRDALNFPEAGKYHVFDLEFAGDLYDQKTTYTKLFTSIEAYYRITGRLNIHPKLALGTSSAMLPYFDQFSLGGLHNFFGLYEDEFLGRNLVQGDLELRYKLLERIYLAAGYSAGNLWKKMESVGFSDLRHGIGIGLALKTPIGPVEGWYGRTNKGIDAFYLTVGYEW